MFNENFKRHENKYMVSADTRKSIEDTISKYMQQDEYGESTITSVYYDDERFSMISRSNEKPLYKEKLRLRAYGGVGRKLMDVCLGIASAEDDDSANARREQDDDIVFAELKKKFKGIVYKRRIPIPLSCIENATALSVTNAMDAAESGDMREYSDRERQIGAEVQACFDRHEGIRPAIATICERTAFKPRETATDEMACELRFTFDSNLRYANMSESEPSENNVFDDGTSIMEVKCVGSYPLWLASLLAELECYPQSFSKCGHALIEISGKRK